MSQEHNTYDDIQKNIQASMDSEHSEEDGLPGGFPEEDSEEDLEGSGEHAGLQGDELDSEEELEEEEEPVEDNRKPKPKKEKAENVHDHIYRLNQEKYRAIDENRQLQAEVERLRNLSDFSAQTALKNYDDNVMHRLENAKALYARARESGDVQAETDAQVELNFATGEYQNLLKIKSEARTYQQPNAAPQNYSQPAQQNYSNPVEAAYASRPRETQEWASKNTWFNERSHDYDHALANEAHSYAKEFENNLLNSGNAHYIGSREFFDYIDKHVEAVRTHRQQGNRGLNMKEARSPVSSNRSGRGSGGRVSGTGSILTDRQADFSKYLARAGVDRKTYEKYVKHDRQTNPQDYRGR